MVADALYIEILHKILVCNSGAWVACRQSRPRSPLDCSVQVSHVDWTACCSPGPVHTADWSDWTIKNTGSFRSEASFRHRIFRQTRSWLSIAAWTTKTVKKSYRCHSVQAATPCRRVSHRSRSCPYRTFSSSCSRSASLFYTPEP
jgi:hypothetical protein